LRKGKQEKRIPLIPVFISPNMNALSPTRMLYEEAKRGETKTREGRKESPEFFLYKAKHERGKVMDYSHRCRKTRKNTRIMPNGVKALKTRAPKL